MNNKFIITVALIASFSAFAQAPNGFYAAAGFNNSSLKSSDIPATGSSVTYGISWDGGYHESYNFQIDFLGSKETFDFNSLNPDTGAIEKSKTKASLSLMSLYLNYFLIKPDEDKVYLGLSGGVFGSFTSGTWNGSYDPYSENLSNTLSLLNFYKFNYGPSLGVVAGYNRFKFAVKYNIGMDNVMSQVHEAGTFDSSTGYYTGNILKGKVNSISAILYFRIFGH